MANRNLRRGLAALLAMHRPLATFAICALAIGASSAVASGATGTYVGANPQAAFLVDIVQAGNQLTGRYEQYDQRADHGAGHDTTYTLTAVIDGTHFAGQIKSSEFLGGTIPVSGDVDGKTFKMNGDASFHLALTRADQQAFQQLMANVKSSAVIGQNIAKVSDLTRRMEVFEEDARRGTAGFSSMENQVSALTEKMRGELAREKTIFGTSGDLGRRAEISGNIHSFNGDARQIAATVRGAGDGLGPRAKQLKADALEAAANCEPVLKVDGSSPLHEACRRFSFEDSKFKQGLAETKDAFVHFDAVWKRELQEQIALTNASDIAVRQPQK